MHLHSKIRAAVALTIGLVTAAGLLAINAAPAHAGQVGINLSIEGAGSVTVVDGSLEDGAAATCIKYDNQDHRVTVSCPRVRNDEPFEAWAWLRPQPAAYPANEWVFLRWDGCDELRSRDGVTECGVHSGAFSSDERYPIARFRDVKPPAITGLRATQLATPERTFQFDFSVAGATTCQVEGETTFTPCTSGLTHQVDEGARWFRVRAADLSGNVSTEETRFVSIDTWLTRAPSVNMAIRTAKFEFESLAGETFLCDVDEAGYVPCGDGPRATLELNDLSEGYHLLRVVARTGDWTDPIPAQWRWRVDTIRPESVLTATTQGTSAKFSLAASEVAQFRCRLTTPTSAGLWDWCGDRLELEDLEQGEHTFHVLAVDAAGNVEATPSVYTWTVDTVAPATVLIPTTSRDGASFQFSALDAETFECRLTRPTGATAWEACTSPIAYLGLPIGPHRFEVRGTDARGNVEPAPASHSWTVSTDPVVAPPQSGTGSDRTAPDTAITGPSGFVPSRVATFGLSSEQGASFRCTYDAAPVPCGAKLGLARLRAGTHTVTAAAVDMAGNVDPTPAVATWTVPVTARELGKAKGWRILASTSSYGRARLESTRRNAQLSYRARAATSVALVVGKGRRHGTVKVYAGSRLVRTVRLAAPRTASSVVVPVTTFSTPYTGRLRVVVATQGRTVQIEGLGVATG